ncbi:MAG TPA: ATP-binding protein [Cyclobacteriaceae bacterium]|nr:ATP-binding protein [Cyclobacteriaceae bacterium]
MNYQYSIGCSLENLKGVRDFIRKSLRSHVASDVVLNEIILAMDEMCSNLMIHAHQCNPRHTLELQIEVPAKGKIIFEILDDGEMFDINRFHEPGIDSLIHEKRKGGLGIRLVKSIMDEVQYINRDGRNVCRLTKTIA